MEKLGKCVWIFLGEGARHPAAVFSDRVSAEAWIRQSGVSGLLTAYPLNQSVYDWAIERGFFTPKEPYQKETRFLAKFSSAHLEHYHFIEGERET